MALKTKRQLFGQHFLRDQSVIGTILQEYFSITQETGTPHLLEIGPGRGALTEGLLEWATVGPGNQANLKSLRISEMDRVLIGHWHQRLKELQTTKAVSILPGDFLKLADEAWLPKDGQGLTVLSNLPYSSGTAILTHLASFPRRINGMVLMFQAEVAERLRAEPGTKAWGSLSIWIQNRWEVKQLLRVAPGAFYPPPKVWSEVVTLTPRKEPFLPPVPGFTGSTEDEALEKMLKVFFQQRRKMLRSSLPAAGPWRHALEVAGIEGTLRPEQLGWDDWRSIIQALSKP